MFRCMAVLNTLSGALRYNGKIWYVTESEYAPFCATISIHDFFRASVSSFFNRFQTIIVSILPDYLCAGVPI